ncbi:MAG: hypothetical protein WCC97_18660 [Candidatus Acidiferrales bacterium]
MQRTLKPAEFKLVTAEHRTPKQAFTLLWHIRARATGFEKHIERPRKSNVICSRAETMSPEWLTAIGTLGLAIVAFVTIFRDQIREWVRHPEFEVEFEPGWPDCNRIRLDFQRTVHVGATIQNFVASAETHWIRARVKNIGKMGAEDVEVSVTQVRRRGADRVFRSVPMNTPWNLAWKDMSSVLPRLPVGGVRHIDIGHVVDPAARNQILGEDRSGSDPTLTLFSLAFASKSNTGEYLLEPGEYEIDFQIFAANANPSRIFTFSLNHTGEWFLDEGQMYREGLGLGIR